MKGRESGMPDEPFWDTFYDVGYILKSLGCAKKGDEVMADLGCGYGTFSLPASRLSSGTIFAFDIEEYLVNIVIQKALLEERKNVVVSKRDLLAENTGLPPRSVDYVMLFNILHVENPNILLDEAYRIAKEGGTLAVIHWKYDPTTPRGPSLEIRPRPEQCVKWAIASGFEFSSYVDLSIGARFHYGLLFRRPAIPTEAIKAGQKTSDQDI